MAAILLVAPSQLFSGCTIKLHTEKNSTEQTNINWDSIQMFNSLGIQAVM
jgi:hypothetical protein